MVQTANQWKQILVIYALGSEYEKFDVWNEITPQSKFPCGPLDFNWWVDNKFMIGRTWFKRRSYMIQTSISSCSKLKGLGSLHEKIDVWTEPKQT